MMIGTLQIVQIFYSKHLTHSDSIVFGYRVTRVHGTYHINSDNTQQEHKLRAELYTHTQPTMRTHFSTKYRACKHCRK